MQWDDLRYLLAIARTGSMSEAARALSVNQSTVSRRLSALENTLNTQLVHRGREGTALTPAGEDLMQTAEAVETDVLRAESRLVGRDTQVAGQITLACPDAMLEHYLASHLANFSGIYPKISLNLISGVIPVDVMRREADVAIRVSTRPPEMLVGRRLVDFALGVYAAKGAVSKGSSSDTVNWIGWNSETRTRTLITKIYPKVTVRHRTDSMLSLLRMVRAGLGVSVLPCYLVAHDPDFERVDFEGDRQKKNGLWVLAHPDVSRAARVQVLTKFLSQIILADRKLFEGAMPEE